MKKILTTLGISILIFGCMDDESAEAPKPKPKPKPAVPAEPPEPEFVSLEEELNGPSKPEPAKFVEPANKPAPAAPIALDANYTPNLNQTGNYVVQVGTSSNDDDAQAMVKKISRLGYEAYTVDVTNPGDLEGTFIRVRVGYFTTITDARLFGHNILKPAGISFWIDNRSGDVGNTSSQASSYEEDQFEDQEKFEQAAPSEPTPAPVAEPEAEDEWDTPAPKAEPEVAKEEPKKEETPAPKAEEPKAEPAKAADDWETPEAKGEPKVVKEEPKPAQAAAPAPETKPATKAEPAPAKDDWEAPAASQPSKGTDAWSDDEGWE